MDERIDEGVLKWFGHVKRMENDRIAKRMYVGESAGSRYVGWPRKSWKHATTKLKERRKKQKSRFRYWAREENGT